MAEEINNKNIFLNFCEKIKDVSNKKEPKEESVRSEEGLFDNKAKENNDVKKIPDTIEKYTKDKYGNKEFLDKLEEMEDYSEEYEPAEDKINASVSYAIDGNNKTEEPVISKKANNSDDINPAVKGISKIAEKLISEGEWQTETTTDEDGNEITERALVNEKGEVIRTETETTTIINCDNPYKQTRIETADKNGKIMSTTDIIEDLKTGTKSSIQRIKDGSVIETKSDKFNNEIWYKRTEVEGSTLKTKERDENGIITETSVKYEANGNIIENKSITRPNGQPIYVSDRTEDVTHNQINSNELVYDEEGRPAEMLTVRSDRDGNVEYFSTDTYEYSEYKGNTADPTESVTINHTSNDASEENYTYTETTHLLTGDINQIYASPTGKITTNLNEYGEIKSETIFTPANTSSEAIYGMSETELVNYCEIGSNNEPGDYITYSYDDCGDPEIVSAYHIDASGEITQFTDNEKSHNLLLRTGYDEKIGISYQHATGDCWTLSALNALSYSERGREILDDALEYTEEGAVVHTYFGDYEVSYEEIEAGTKAEYTEEEYGFDGKKYSTGDIDVLVFELATEKLRSDISEGIYTVKQDNFIDGYDGIIEPEFENDVLSGGWGAEMIYYLTGNQSNEVCKKTEQLNILEEYMENPDMYALNCGFKDNCTIKDSDGNTIKLYGAHEYAIKSFDGENITVVNPWDSGTDLVISAEDFIKNSAGIEYTDLSSVERDNGLFDENKFFSINYLFAPALRLFI